MAALDDPDRAFALDETGLMDSPPEEAFDRVARLASTLLGTPTALVSFIDGQRQFIKAAVGVDEPWKSAREATLSDSICRLVAATGDVVAVENASQDPRVADLPSVQGGIRAYLGVPLTLRNGHTIGALCTVDVQPRKWEPRDVAVLRELARLVTSEAEARRTALTHEADSALLRAILESMEDAVIVVDPLANVLVANRAVRLLLGDLAGMDHPSWPTRKGLFLPDQTTVVPGPRMPLRRALKGEVVRGEEIFVDSPRVRARWQSINAGPVRDAQGRVTGAVMVGRDITEAKRLEVIAAREQDQLLLLLEVATRVNAAPTPEAAFASVIPEIGRRLGWPVVHVQLRDGELFRSAAWYVADARFESFRRATEAVAWPTDPTRRQRFFEEKRPIVIADLGATTWSRREAAAAAGLNTAMFAPVLIGDEVVAVLELYTGATLPADTDPGVIPQIGVMLGRAIERGRAAEAARAHAAALEQLSVRDALTGAYNRRGLQVMGEPVLALARRKKRPACLLYFDLDGLKRANDTFGHAAGDALIRDAADLLTASFREIDIVARIGGDELVVLCPETSGAAAEGILARLGEKVAAKNLERDSAIPLAWSAGCAEFDPDEPRALDELLAAADAAMFVDKTRRRASR
jgi:diguanylate cyclase (GGDEF)-like protein/PAS domain S-box-containing protein